jgi:glutathione synthetase
MTSAAAAAAPVAKHPKYSSSGLLTAVVPHAVAFATTHGVLMVSKTQSNLVHHAPITALPAPFPKALFAQAVDLATSFNLLVDAVARDDSGWLVDVLSGVSADPFTARLVRMFEACGKPKQRLYLGIHRSDYMVDVSSSPARLRQIELNTISASFACLSTRVSQMHRSVLSGVCTRENLDLTGFGLNTANNLPVNDAENQLAFGLFKAHEAYMKSSHVSAVSMVVVAFIVQEGERNEYDQRHLEFALLHNHGVHVKRLTLGDVNARCRLDSASSALLLDEMEIAVAYFRAGYRPEDYLSEKEWAGRLMIENSLAIKCPSVAYQLVGTKKVQQALADPAVLAKFVGKPTAEKLQACFAGLWSLGKDVDLAVVKDAKLTPGKYVLKPQREGGGNNYYNEDVRIKLETMSSEELSAHILMERVFPKLQPVLLLREGQAVEGKGISELGVFSVFLGGGGGVLVNQPAGHLLRTKLDGVDEGGVASGFACLDSPFLVEE